MATLDDAYNQLVVANGHLTDIHNDVQAVKASTDSVNTSVQATTAAVQSGFAQLSTLVDYTNKLLQFEIKQNETIICNLEKVARQTCELVNQSVRQTVAQEASREDLSDLKQLFSLANPAAAGEQARLEALERKIEECCPPKEPEPPCKYEPCREPGNPPRPPRGQKVEQPG
jgi:paraquat-inducible protein B